MTDNQSEPVDAESLRAEIEEIDQQLMLLLGLRFRCTDQLSERLVSEGVQKDPGDGEDRVEFMERLALDTGVSPVLAIGLMKAVAQAVAENHQRIKASRSH